MADSIASYVASQSRIHMPLRNRRGTLPSVGEKMNEHQLRRLFPNAISSNCTTAMLKAWMSTEKEGCQVIRLSRYGFGNSFLLPVA